MNEIYIYGEITDYQGDDAEVYGATNPKYVLNQLNKIKGDEILVRINSNGGSVDAGFAIYDILRNSGKKIITQIEGQCYSIATVIYLAGDERKATSNSQFLIHNPWTMAMGDSAEFKKTAGVLEAIEAKLANFYAERAGNITTNTAIEEMAKDTFMSLDQAMEYGFINSIIETVKAVAIHTNMSKDKDVEAPDSAGILASIAALFAKEKPAVKALVLKSADDTDVDFFELEEGQEPSIGDKATIGGEDADGSVVMTDGRTFVFASGALESITEAEGDGDDEDVTDAKDKEIETLKAEIEELKNASNPLDSVVSDLKNKVDGFETIMNGLKELTSDVIVDDKSNSKPNEQTAEKGIFAGFLSESE